MFTKIHIKARDPRNTKKTGFQDEQTLNWEEEMTCVATTRKRSLLFRLLS